MHLGTTSIDLPGGAGGNRKMYVFNGKEVTFPIVDFRVTSQRTIPKKVTSSQNCQKLKFCWSSWRIQPIWKISVSVKLFIFPIFEGKNTLKRSLKPPLCNVSFVYFYRLSLPSFQFFIVFLPPLGGIFVIHLRIQKKDTETEKSYMICMMTVGYINFQWIHCFLQQKISLVLFRARTRTHHDMSTTAEANKLIHQHFSEAMACKQWSNLSCFYLRIKNPTHHGPQSLPF